MSQPIPRLGIVSNMFVRQMEFQKAGDAELGHKHAFDHLTLLAKGSLRVTCDGEVTDFKAPMMIFIRADQQHELVALEDDTVAYCIHGLRGDNQTGDLIDPAMVPSGPALRELAKRVVSK
jgi:quercetin dioxygenase-like cupin family protein